MESKYYTPSIEEFHVGFEFECTTSPNKDDWYHDVIRNVDDMCEVFSYSKARVKYLDREDIESLGWEYSMEQILPANIIGTFEYKHYYGYFYKKGFCRIQTTNRYAKEGGNFFKDIFVGTIKNKSELKKLLKQLGI